MDLQSRKIAFVQEFLKLQNEEIVVHLEEVLHQKKKANTNEVKVNSNKGIWEAIKPIKKSYAN